MHTSYWIKSIPFILALISGLTSCASWVVDYNGPGEDAPVLPQVRKSDLSNVQEFPVMHLPDDPVQVWQRIASPDNLERYKAVNGRTKCNIFLGDMISAHFGNQVYSKVFPEGMRPPNRLYEDWKTNPELIRLHPDQFTIQDIQEMADNGYLIILAYHHSHGPGHVAFIGNIGLELKTIPPLPGLEGKKGSSLNSRWLPVVVQAGTYTGTTSMVYASNGWLRRDLFKKGIVCYYLIRL